jgi:preprotein translocase subunit SecF
MFTLTSLLLFGGDTIFNFVLILLIGLISGTYSSIFNAAQILVVWENREWQNWFKGGAEEPSPAGG